ncbi:MAG TPA: UpxY family transcription antiterminator [Syntrophales bacterium]|nr:UpxY family transcription antiterminator [Syntrophales bacterium]
MPWYAVHTRSRHESKVCDSLVLKSIEAFLPKIEVWSRRKDRRKKIQLPMFPGYLFVQLAPADNQARLDILKTAGVVKMLGTAGGNVPIPVPDDKIEAIRRLVDSKVEIQHYRYPRVGERARILDGPFKEIEGLVVKADLRKDLFVITIEILQRAVAIEMQGFQVERI